jgi:hypothetical protein
MDTRHRLCQGIARPLADDEILCDPKTFGGGADFCLIEKSSRAPVSSIKSVSQRLLRDLKVRSSMSDDFLSLMLTALPKHREVTGNTALPPQYERLNFV